MIEVDKRAAALERCVELAARVEKLNTVIRSRGGVVTVGEAREIAVLRDAFAELRREYLGDIDDTQGWNGGAERRRSQKNYNLTCHDMSIYL